jgi:L-lactate dehydrogenase complex protein LldF
MTTEEIGLNAALSEAGIDAVETDLGEYIVQLRGERPSHIITPAIHLSKEDIGQLFSEKLEIPYTAEPEALTAVARERLRPIFLGAAMGVTGVNFAIAETGTLVLVENEGNGRLSSTMPEVFVAVMGIEKVIPKLEDLSLSSKFWRAQPPARSLPAIPISSAPRATTATSTVCARCTW